MLGSLHPSGQFDLHLHSENSDGRYPPSEVLARAARAGLDVIALTDHDLVSELPVGEHTIEGKRITLLGGAEVTGTHAGREYHLLVYFPGTVPQGFRAFCAQQTKARAERYEQARVSLDLGLPEATEAARRGERALTRLHLARAIVDGGHAASVQGAFSRYLGSSHGHVPTLGLTLIDAITLARSFGGLTSWAHPPVPAVKAHVAELAQAGLQGLEALRPRVRTKDRGVYRRAAARHGLFLTGGSDWHGWGSDGDLGLFRVQAREIGPFVDTLLAA